MRILHVGKYYHPFRGGIENFCVDLCRSQVAAGHDVCVLAHDEARRNRTRFTDMDGVRVIKAANLGELVYAPMAPTFGFQFLRLLRQFRPQVVHLHMPNLSAAWLAAKAPRAPLVVHWHSDVAPSQIDARLNFFYTFYKPMETRVLKLARAVIATSPDYLQTSEPLSRIAGKCRAIPLGLDPARLAVPSGPPRCLPPGDFDATILSVGRFTYYKGFEHLIRAIADAPGLRAVIAGQGPLRSRLRALAAELGVAGRVIMPGAVDDQELVALYRACDVFCLPSVERTEAFGLVLLEAMAHGLPLVTTHVRGSGMNAVNQNGVTGLAVPPADHRALAQALRTVALDNGKRMAMSEACMKRFADAFHINSVRQAIDNLYELLL